MTKRSLIHICIFVSCIILAAGAAVGTVCHFLFGEFFNYGVDYASGAKVTVSYYLIDFSQDEVEDICTSAFESQGLSGYTLATSEDDGYIEYAFSSNTDSSKLESAVAKINDSLESGSGNEYSLNIASYHYYGSLVNNSSAYIWCAVAAAIAIGVQAVYIAIRYRIDMGAVSIIANIHSLLLLAAVLAITRLPFGTYVVAVMALCLLISMIALQLYFSKVRANFRDEDMSNLSTEEKIASARASSNKKILWLCVVMLIVCAVYAIAAFVATFSFTAAVPAVAAICACVVNLYSTAVFTPSVYAKVRGNKADKNAKKAKKAKKAN